MTKKEFLEDEFKNQTATLITTILMVAIIYLLNLV